MKYLLQDMHCQHCVSRIQTALTAAGIVHQVTLDSRTVDIEGDGAAQRQAVEILDDLGFEAVLMK